MEEKRRGRVTFGAPATYGSDLEFVILCHKPNVHWLVGTKHTAESKPCPRIWFLGSIFFRFWGVLLNSGTCFESGAFFGFQEVFLEFGACFGFWEVFCTVAQKGHTCKLKIVHTN